ncbi:MAG TPA: SRPBCC family protein [Pyrinomonadaceae bacterium]|nr:SRPBCC family protein [Pyrinomonadaceae bacterium]
MPTYKTTSTATIQAPAELVYNILADYHVAHPSILPEKYFQALKVEQGGFGAGTVIKFNMHVGNQLQTFRSEISEPVPGQVLLEQSLDQTGLQTRFEVVPVAEALSKVTFTTTGQTRRRGLLGYIERLVTEMFLQRVYRQELQKLSEFATRKMTKK